jgi:hypothetical protein
MSVSASFANTSSFISSVPLMGNIASHVNITSEWHRHQAKNEAPANMHVSFRASE